MKRETNTAVLLLAHGTPESAQDIPAFLSSVTGGRPLDSAVVDEVTHRYTLIERSPLRELTLKQAEGVQRELGIPVYVGMRNWKPFIQDVVSQMVADGIKRTVAICLAPQNSRTSVGLYRQALMRAAPDNMVIDFIESWHDHPLLVRAFAEKLNTGWLRACTEAGSRVPVIFTAHSVPERTISEGDPYEQQARHTAELVAGSAQPPPAEWRFAFQSQGMSGGPWLGPTVEDTISALQSDGHTGVFIQPIGFLCDHVEILYDIDIGFRKYCGQRGMRLWRAESLNDSPILVAALADLVSKKLASQMDSMAK